METRAMSFHDSVLTVRPRPRPRGTIFSSMKSAPHETDFLVIGAGIAGLRAAIELAGAGRVLVLAKKELTESATQYAQGGIAAALSDEEIGRASCRERVKNSRVAATVKETMKRR